MSRPFFISPRELIGWIVLLDTFIALMLWWGLAESFWIAMVYSHAIGSSILLLQEIVRRQLWPDASCFPPVRSFWWMMAVLVPIGTLLGGSLAAWLTGQLPVLGGLDFSSSALSMGGIALAASAVSSVWFWQRARLADAKWTLAASQRAQTLAELRLLQAQIEPHFLFNTLSHLDALLGTGESDKAQALLDHLTRYLRSTLYATQREHASLADEIALLEPYLEILKVRFGARLQWTIAVSPEGAACALPPILLQPLVENAVRHGLEPCVAGGRLVITAQCEGGCLRLSVQDDGVGLTLPLKATGTGLANIRARLHTLFGAEGTLLLSPRHPCGTHAVLTLPAELP